MITRDLPAADYTVAITDPLNAVAAVAGSLGVRPCYLQVAYNEYRELVHGRPFEVSVQTRDATDADRLADHYGLPADDGEGTNYTREGEAAIRGIGEVDVRVYTGRPDDEGAEVPR